MTPFDPLHKWLGIPPYEQPPDHYRLLSIPRYESDLEVIAHAADRQMAHVRSFHIGPHAMDSQRLLNELSAVRVCLLNPDRKAAYDAALRAELSTPEHAPIVAPPLIEPPVHESAEDFQHALDSTVADDAFGPVDNYDPSGGQELEPTGSHFDAATRFDVQLTNESPANSQRGRIQNWIGNWQTIVTWKPIVAALGLTTVILLLGAYIERSRSAEDAAAKEAQREAARLQAEEKRRSEEEARRRVAEIKTRAQEDANKRAAEGKLRADAEAKKRAEEDAKRAEAAKKEEQKILEKIAQDLVRIRAEDAAKNAAKERLAAIAKKFKEQNGSFDETRMTAKIDRGAVVELTVNADGITDLSPLRELSDLKVLSCRGSGESARKTLCDLSPLRGMALKELNFQDTNVADLSPLQGMPLTRLTCDVTPVADLAPLKGMPLGYLSCSRTKVSSLSPLAGMALGFLYCGHTSVSDLSPLKGMRLTSVSCVGTNVSDLSPLAGMPLLVLDCTSTPVASLAPLKKLLLFRLECRNTRVSDLSPLHGMRLSYLDCSDTKISDLSPLEGVPLTYLNCESTGVTSVSPLAGLPLTKLNCSYTGVSNISPLYRCPTLVSLDLQYTKVREEDVVAFRKAFPRCVTPFLKQ